MEVWKDIKDYEGLYKISNLGNIESLDKNKIIKSSNQFKQFIAKRIYKGKRISQVLNKNGYYQVALYKNGKSCNKLVHRLVAHEFLDNVENKPTVNHINGIKTDNRVENLEWATYKEQTIHCIKVLKQKKNRQSNRIHQKR